jgi:23S rRNA (uracil1939-C5)-methyltransferase
MNLKDITNIIIRCINNKIMINILGNIDSFNIDCDSLYINNKYIKGEEYLIDEIDNYKFSIYPESFYQVNKEGMINIYNEAKKYIGSNNSLLDLYCGTGTIGIWNNKDNKNITGIEINSSSIKNANINKKLNNINNIEFICDDASNVKGTYDTIVVDPPRSGSSSKKTMNFLNNSNSKRIVYISCNPNTLKRDIDNLTNYELKSLSCCDMFPRTKHIESVAVIERK